MSKPGINFEELADFLLDHLLESHGVVECALVLRHGGYESDDLYELGFDDDVVEESLCLYKQYQAEVYRQSTGRCR